MEGKLFVTIAMVMVCMIGMTGLAMAGSTVHTSGDEGSYSTQWHGSNIDVGIHTYTANGEDHLSTAGRFGGGSQTMDDGAWTRIDRRAVVFGADAYIYADTIDNSGDGVSVGASTEYGHAGLYQEAKFRDGNDRDVVKSDHGMSASAWCGADNASVYSVTFTPSTETAVGVVSDGFVMLGAEAKAFTNDNGREKSKQKQISAMAFGDGTGYIGAVGDYKVDWDLTIYQNGAYTMVYNNTGPISVDHISEFSRDHRWRASEYRATGYIYAVSRPQT